MILSSEMNTSSIAGILVIPLLLLWYIYWRLSRRHMIELAEKIPGPKCLPLIGNALLALGSSQEIFKTAYNLSFKYPTIVRAWLGPKLAIFLLDPRDAEIILSSSEHIDKSAEYKFFEPWFGNGLLISTGTKWKVHRKLIAPTFHLSILKSFIDLFNVNSRDTVQKLRDKGGETFDCHDVLSEATVEILLETVMGVSKRTQDQSGFEYAMAVMKMCDILHLRHAKIHLRLDWFFNLTKYSNMQKKLLSTIHSLTNKVVEKKKDAFNNGFRGSLAEVPEELQSKDTSVSESKFVEKPSDGGLMVFGQSVGIKDDLDGDDIGEKKRMAFLDSLIESSQNGVQLTEEELKQQVSTIMFEGHDTTAAASSFFLCLMGEHLDIQAKVHQEMDAIFGNSDRPATFADTLEMKYLERCLLETLRMYPPVPIIARKLNQDVKMASGEYTLPAGCSVGVAIYKIHRNANIYPNPDVFNPDNFLPERCAKRHYYSFIPFSAGPRGCVGRKYAVLKLKILLSTIMRNFTVKSEVPESEYQLQGDIILKRADGFRIRLENRNLTA